MNSFDLAGFVSKKAFVKYIDIVFWIICIIYYTIKITSRYPIDQRTLAERECFQHSLSFSLVSKENFRVY